MTDDRHWLLQAIELSRRCPRSDRSFAVGAVLLDATGRPVSTGFSLELGPGWHAEEAALAKADGVDLRGGTIYSSLEPCSVRLSGKRSCVEHLVAAGLRRVVFALHEPMVFVRCEGEAKLREAGLEVVVLGDDAELVWAINRHVLPGAWPPPASTV